MYDLGVPHDAEIFKGLVDLADGAPRLYEFIMSRAVQGRIDDEWREKEHGALEKYVERAKGMIESGSTECEEVEWYGLFDTLLMLAGVAALNKIISNDPD